MSKRLGKYKGRPIVTSNKRYPSALTEKELLKELGCECNGDDGSVGGGSSSRPKWTGHADAEGLRAIGWTDEDIAYYQENGVNWNAEDDEYHKVSEDNKALYGVLTADNIQTYKDRIVYLPKIDTSNVTSMNYMFDECYSLVAIPQLDTSNVTSMMGVFSYCHSLVIIPQLDTSNVTNMMYMFKGCYALVTIPQFDTSKVTSTQQMFEKCYALVAIPPLDMSVATSLKNMFNYCYSLVTARLLNSYKVQYMDYLFSGCSALLIAELDTKVAFSTNMFSNNYSLQHLYMKNIKNSFSFASCFQLSKESLLYLINNEAATSAITITLHSYAYQKLAEDADIVAALAEHPNLSLASA